MNNKCNRLKLIGARAAIIVVAAAGGSACSLEGRHGIEGKDNTSQAGELVLIKNAQTGDGESAFKLSKMYEAKNCHFESSRWLVVSAELEHPIAAYNLGVTYMYYPDYRNLERAEYWLHIAAKNDDELAKGKLLELKKIRETENKNDHPKDGTELPPIR